MPRLSSAEQQRIRDNIKKRKRRAEERARDRKSQVAIAIMREFGSPITPAELWDDRDRRLNAPRTLTMIICGDPPYQQSALGRVG